MLMGDPRSRVRVESENAARRAATDAARNDTQRFITFAIGGSRFALDSAKVTEVVMPDRVYSFPHTMPALQGVLVRRGVAIPVCNVVSAFGETGPCSRYVIVECVNRGASHAVAIPVSGDCELVQGTREPGPEGLPLAPVTDVTFVAGLLRTESGTVPLLDMDKVVAHCIQPQPQHAEIGRAEDPVSAGVPGWNLRGEEARQ